MDLNMMLRQQAQAGLQTQLDAAVTNGDTEAARKITDQIAQLAVQTAPKANAYGDAEIKAALEAKAPWFGVDPKKSAKAMEFGKTMDPKKFATAQAFADAVAAAVEAEFTPAAPARKDDEGEGDEGAEGEGDEGAEDDEKKPDPKRKRTDGPGENDMGGNRTARRANSNAPWTKITDAPADVQTEIKRAADKFAPKTKEGREGFIKRALESHQRMRQQKAK